MTCAHVPDLYPTLRLAQDAHDLLFTVSAPFHGVLFSWFWSQNYILQPSYFQGSGQSNWATKSAGFRVIRSKPSTPQRRENRRERHSPESFCRQKMGVRKIGGAVCLFCRPSFSAACPAKTRPPGNPWMTHFWLRIDCHEPKGPGLHRQRPPHRMRTPRRMDLLASRRLGQTQPHRRSDVRGLAEGRLPPQARVTRLQVGLRSDPGGGDRHQTMNWHEFRPRASTAVNLKSWLARTKTGYTQSRCNEA